jgi:hypothetical protein
MTIALGFTQFEPECGVGVCHLSSLPRRDQGASQANLPDYFFIHSILPK